MRQMLDQPEGSGTARVEEPLHPLSELLQRFAREMGPEWRIPSQVRGVSARGAVQFD